MKCSGSWLASAFSVLFIFLASCAQIPTPDTQVVVLSDGAALRKDAGVYAQTYNVSLDEAIKRLELQDEVGKLDARLVQEKPSSYAGLWITHGQDFGIVVNMTSELDAVSDFTQGTPLSSIADVQKVSKSLLQLETEQGQADAKLREQKIAHESGINIYKNQAEVYVQDPTRVNSLTSTANEDLPQDVAVIKTESFSSDLVNAYAGNTMSACTAGYSVINPQGLYGITTAGHCGNTQSYGSISLKYMNQWWSGARDVQWHSAKTAGNPLFKPWARDANGDSSTAYFREMWAVANRPDQPIGAFVCKYGYRTGHTCGTIIDKNFNPAGPSYGSNENNSPTFIRLDRGSTTNLARGGDSGGPVYVGHQAYGLVKGGWNTIDHPDCTPSFCGDMIYMAANYVASTGLRIYLAPR